MLSDALMAAAFGAGVLHALAPDHWLSITVLAKERGWSKGKLLAWVFLAGWVHVVFAYVLAWAALGFGISEMRWMQWEDARATAFSFFLAGLGLAYLILAAKRLASSRPLPYLVGALVALGPCELLIPFIFIGATESWARTLHLFLFYSAGTIGTMCAVSLLAFHAVTRFGWRTQRARARQLLAGTCLAALGFLGLVF